MEEWEKFSTKIENQEFEIANQWEEMQSKLITLQGVQRNGQEFVDSFMSVKRAKKLITEKPSIWKLQSSEIKRN